MDNALFNQQPQLFCLKTVKLLSELNEASQSRLLEVLGECGQTSTQELVAILENQVLAKGEAEAFVHPFPDDLHVHLGEDLPSYSDELRSLSPKIVK